MSEMARLRLPGDADLRRLEQRIGTDRVSGRPEALERYVRDESTRLSALPTAVVKPESAEEVAGVLRWASEGLFPIIPRGAGTGMSGGAVAVGGGVILSLERLDRVLEIDEENLTVTCEPGVITASVGEAVAPAGLFYPPDPASLETCSIGGNVAVGAGGPRALKYGTTRNYVLGIRVTLADGTVLELGGKNVKDASGYHLLGLFIGSEGTLGVITRVTLRVVPRPLRRASLLAVFPNLTSCARAVARNVRARVLPSVAEFMDDVAIGAVRRHLGRALPGGGDGEAFGFFELDGDDSDLLLRQLLAVEEVARSEGASDVFAAEDEGQQARLWEARRTVSDALKALSPEIGKADVVVPKARVPELVDAIKGAGRRHGLAVACFGHAGDGNVHVNVLRGSLPEEGWQIALAGVMDEVMDRTRELGGLPSGEHGIGVLKKPYLGRFLSEAHMRLMRGVKASFDPLGILNPSKVF